MSPVHARASPPIRFFREVRARSHRSQWQLVSALAFKFELETFLLAEGWPFRIATILSLNKPERSQIVAVDVGGMKSSSVQSLLANQRAT